MESYEYEENMMVDVINAIEENHKLWDGYDDMSMEDKEQFLNDELFNYDDVTGNASGSYFCNAYRAQQAVTSDNNINLLVDACEAFGSDLGDTIRDGWECCDVTIRCYLLGQIIYDVLYRC